MRYLILLSALFSFFTKSADIVDISPETLLATPDIKRIILDVRSKSEYDAGHIPGAILVPHTDIELHLAGLQSVKDKPVVVYCETGIRAYKAMSVLKEAGFTQLQHLEGDMVEWRNKNRDIIKN